MFLSLKLLIHNYSGDNTEYLLHFVSSKVQLLQDGFCSESAGVATRYVMLQNLVFSAEGFCITAGLCSAAGYCSAAKHCVSAAELKVL